LIRGRSSQFQGRSTAHEGTLSHGLLVVGYLFSASKVPIEARNFSGVDNMLNNVAPIVACGDAAGVAPVRELGKTR